ncbi:MAG: hypothetical protein KME04_04785 [Pleurocapsa minor GSE-CHR-MK-17-07R]|jgi:hypothetical protein|nr:hypothetical protein [Pleurocapsa minor GSE-CHR-MK 17-07R]
MVLVIAHVISLLVSRRLKSQKVIIKSPTDAGATRARQRSETHSSDITFHYASIPHHACHVLSLFSSQPHFSLIAGPDAMLIHHVGYEETGYVGSHRTLV